MCAPWVVPAVSWYRNHIQLQRQQNASLLSKLWSYGAGAAMPPLVTRKLPASSSLVASWLTLSSRRGAARVV